MALIRYGGGIIQMSGSIAGNTYARNRYGNYCRARTIPTNPNTANQADVRAALAELAARWSQTLSAAERTAWNLYGSSVAMKNKLGEVVNLSGFNHYIRSGVIALVQGLPYYNAGPVVFELPAQDNTLAVTASEATQQLTVAYNDGLDWCTDSSSRLHIFQGQPQNAQRNFFAGPWLYFGWVHGDVGAPPASPLAGNVRTAIAEGQRQWVYARIQRADGRLSQPFRADCFVAA